MTTYALRTQNGSRITEFHFNTAQDRDKFGELAEKGELTLATSAWYDNATLAWATGFFILAIINILSRTR